MDHKLTRPGRSANSKISNARVIRINLMRSIVATSPMALWTVVTHTLRELLIAFVWPGLGRKDNIRTNSTTFLVND